MKNRKKQKKQKEISEKNLQGVYEGELTFSNNPHALHYSYPDINNFWVRDNKKWICDTCGYQEDQRSRNSIRFSIGNLDTEDLCPSCIINFLTEHIPRLREVEDDNE